MTLALRSALLAIPLITAGLLGATTPASAAPTPLTCGGKGINPAAKLHHRTQTFIKAPLATVWDVHTKLEAWPTWQPAVTTMKRLDPGPLRPGSRFRWTTPAPPTPTTPATTLVITSTVHQLKPHHCVRWSGPAIGQGLRIDQGIHVWTFTPVQGGVVVQTEESWTGAQIEADPATAIKYLAPGLDLWLADLKTTAESRVCR
ncbi:SRPBCC family protein [Actinokineospora diospyrosa]|uniref:Polyketide cyclase / dehydrase and lipid transport n=1 Tax=Actinokineospora diospyrosa TaxID=103728 RepID=A0ABT1IFS0_9PSEU|nr:SRPBCC family protein [Actinokineospora diospyrosa]MCP2271493.1 Polyketide cyclase / dehydrase and lipid transport [Actinokineospora diospyrosa]